MISSQPGISSSTNNPKTAYSPNVGSSMIPGIFVLPSHTFQQHHFHDSLSTPEHVPARREEQSQSNMKSAGQLVFEPSPPGMYPNDVAVPRRPPMIMEETIKDFKEKMTVSGRKQSGRRGKDIHRHLRVVYVIGEFIREHNEINREDLYMQYKWYGTDTTDSRITATLLAIIEDTAHALIPHLYSRYTYNDAQKRDCASTESMVARVASHKMVDPLTQNLRAFGIRRLFQEKMATKKKTMDLRQKRLSQKEWQNDPAVNLPPSLTPHSDQATLTVPLPSETHEISNSLDPTSLEAARYQQIDRRFQLRDGQKQLTESDALEPQPAVDSAWIQSRSDRESKQANESNSLEMNANNSSADRGKSSEKLGGKVKRSNGKKVASKHTNRAPKLQAKTGASSKWRVESEDPQKSYSPTPSKSRKCKQVENETVESDGSTDCKDSEEREIELLQLKRRMKQIEKRNRNKKGKKKRSRQ